MDPVFFATPAEFRKWLEEHHGSTTELYVGFHKKRSVRQGMRLEEAVEQALCFGWIDGVLKPLDEDSYAIRFSPRRRMSRWSNVNLGRYEKLSADGLVAPAGKAAFERRVESGYAHERERPAELGPEYEERLRSNAKAWSFFSAQAPWYRRTATHWVVSAKREETRERRLNQLIEDSENGRTIGPLTRPRR